MNHDELQIIVAAMRLSAEQVASDDGNTDSQNERTLEILAQEILHLREKLAGRCITCKHFSDPRGVCTCKDGPLCNSWLSGKEHKFGCIYWESK